jgi:hypothetical protein
MLEPIEESDLDLKSKFTKGGVPKAEKVESENAPKSNLEVKLAPEIVPSPEAAERKEGQMEKEEAYNKILAKVKSPSAVLHDDVSTDAKTAGDETDYENKIIKLVEIAETKGVVHAVKVARHLEDNYLLDELHDRLLATDLHDALVKKGMITEA